MTLLIWECLGFGLGLLFGSFLNVCIVRVPRGLSIARPGSRCVRCGHAVRWFDNVPILSWLLLRGKCRDCRAPISWRYPLIEFAVGMWCLLPAARLLGDWLGDRGIYCCVTTSMRWQWTFDLIGLAILGWLLLGLIAIDAEWHRLPDVFTLSGIATGMFLVCLQAVFLGPKDDQVVLNTTHQLRMSSPGSFAAKGNVFLTGPEALIFGRLAAVCGAALILLLVRWGYKALRGREGLGLGDVKMLAMVAAFLGFWPAVLTLFLGTMLAAGYGVILMARGRAGALTRLPLGSFLGIAGLFAAAFGDGIIQWYRGLLS